VLRGVSAVVDHQHRERAGSFGDAYTIGSRMRPINAFGMWYTRAVSSIEATSTSAQNAVTTVVASNEKAAEGTFIFTGSSSSSPTASATKRCACVFSWNTRYAAYTPSRRIAVPREMMRRPAGSSLCYGQVVSA
jgi:hypothetical protein